MSKKEKAAKNKKMNAAVAKKMADEAEKLRVAEQEECEKHKEKLELEKVKEAEAAAKKAYFFSHNAPGADEGWVADLPKKYMSNAHGPLKYANFA